jgi:hypothetical protein
MSTQFFGDVQMPGAREEIERLRFHVEQLSADKIRLIETLESMARQHCGGGLAIRDYLGQVKGTRVTDSGALTGNEEALEELAKHGRFRIVGQTGRMVVGYWPEDDPEIKGKD